MSQLPSKVILHTPREQLATRAGQTVRQSRPALTMTTGLAIASALVVAVAIAGPVLGSQRAATPAATTDAPQMAQTGTTSAITSASVPEWAGAEGGYFGGARYRPGAFAEFADFAGLEMWPQLEGGALGGISQPSAEVGRADSEQLGVTGFTADEINPSVDQVDPVDAGRVSQRRETASEWVFTSDGFYPEDPSYGGPFPQRTIVASATAGSESAPAIGVGTGDDGLGGYPFDGFNQRVTAASATADWDSAPAIGAGTGDDGLGGYPFDGFNSR